LLFQLYNCWVRKIVLLTVAGAASGFCSFWGVFAWMWLGAGKSHSAPLIGLCLCAALSTGAFVLYFVQPSVGVIVAWILLSGEFISAFIDNLQSCARRHCGMSPFGIAWGTITGLPPIWFLLVAAVGLMLAWTTTARVAGSRVGEPG
jgi:hypothetical protein